MRIAGLIENDFANGVDVCVSLWTQGCPFHCKNCHNPETWDFNGGQEIDKQNLIINLKQLIIANKIQRNFSILGGEPLCEQNRDDVKDIILAIRKAYPNIKIFVWTGYTLEELDHPLIQDILDKIDVLIDGRYEKELRDVTLKMRGSSNQRLLYKGIDF